MKILLVEPFFSGSHRAWAEGFATYSGHQVEILSLTGAYWKWRMHGGAVTLARRFLKGDFQPDLILASDMLDLTTFLAMTRFRTVTIPNAVYFHENQLSYPWSPRDQDPEFQRDRHYGFINYASALAADHVFFNSNFHRSAFLEGLTDFLKRFPDHREPATVSEIAGKASVLPLGLDLRELDKAQPSPTKEREPIPHILWNHRWEHDKNPDVFFDALKRVKNRGFTFRLIVLGQNFDHPPGVFTKAKDWFKDEIAQFGWSENRQDYARWLHRADLLPVTSNHDFFGASVMEAAYCRTIPLLPKRLAYPELFSGSDFDGLFYDVEADMVDRICHFLQSPHSFDAKITRQRAQNFDWQNMASQYDRILEQVDTKGGFPSVPTHSVLRC